MVASEHGGARARRVVLSSGVELHTLRSGPDDPSEAPGWLLVHGLASNARLWDGVARRLAAHGHSVLAVDQRGHGLSDKPDSGYEMSAVADELAELVDIVSWERPILVGQSWGGNVVIEAAARHPQMSRAVVCVDGGFIRLRDRFPEWEECAAVLAPPDLIGVSFDSIRQRVDQWAADWPEEGRSATLANFEVRPDGTIAPWLTRERHMAILHGLWEHEPTEAIARVDVPVRFLVADSGEAAWLRSKHDAVEAAVAASRAADAVWFADAHHDLHAQRPDAVVDSLLDMARRAQGPTTA